MSIFKDVLQEEYQRLHTLKDKYNEELEELPGRASERRE